MENKVRFGAFTSSYFTSSYKKDFVNINIQWLEKIIQSGASWKFLKAVKKILSTR